MNKIAKSILYFGLSVLVVLVSYLFWENYLSFYWNTEMLKGNYENDRIVLCDSDIRYFPEYISSQENELMVSKALDRAKGQAILYFEGRGYVHESEMGSTIQIHEFRKLTHIENPKCPLTNRLN